MSPDLPRLPALSREASEALARRRRGRNIAVALVLLAIAALFYAIAMVKLGQPHVAGS